MACTVTPTPELQHESGPSKRVGELEFSQFLLCLPLSANESCGPYATQCCGFMLHMEWGTFTPRRQYVTLVWLLTVGDITS